MHHGTFGSGTDWIDCGYVDALKADHRVILLDSRGHGESDKPRDPRAYDLALRASDVLAVLDELGVQKERPQCLAHVDSGSGVQRRCRGVDDHALPAHCGGTGPAPRAGPAMCVRTSERGISWFAGV
jgi:hypothetical protein